MNVPVADPAPSPRSTRVVWHLAADERAWVAQASAAIAAALETALAARGSARLLLSGGTTPAPVYRALAAYPLDWKRVVVGLVDERDVGEDAEGSNARLVRDALLHGAAALARFGPLRLDAHTLAESVAHANARWRDDAVDLDTIAVLGMGDDGHTASLFPGAVNLPAAFASTDPYVEIDATGCAVAGAFAHRISLTPHALSTARRVLLIRGARKRAVLETALAPGDGQAFPIRAAIDGGADPLQVHWAV